MSGSLLMKRDRVSCSCLGVSNDQGRKALGVGTEDAKVGVEVAEVGVEDAGDGPMESRLEAHSSGTDSTDEVWEEGMEGRV